MSELQRSFAKAKLAGLPAFPPGSFDEEEEDEGADAFTDLPAEHPDDDSSSASSASSASSTGTIRPTISKNLFARPTGSPSKRSLDEIPWTTYFERELYLQVINANETMVYHAYLISPSGKAPLFVTHHGAGSSGLSFAILASEIRKLLPAAGILSYDARGHGSTTTTPLNSSLPSDPLPASNPDAPELGLDLSLPTLTSDLLAVINSTQTAMSWPGLPPLVLIGHSLGGAVVTTLAHGGELSSSLLGYAVLDVVEGSAIDALTSMHTYLSTRPTRFSSIEQGIEWHIRTRTVRNSLSARTSVPPLLCNLNNGSEKNSTTKPWGWRTDLAATQPFWEGWFVGLSKKFLEAQGGKLLLLAGTDRLDTELMIGQMQGKYALQVFPEAGHFIHEDLPAKTAMAIVDFYRRNDRSALVLPPKVGDLLAMRKAEEGRGAGTGVGWGV